MAVKSSCNSQAELDALLVMGWIRLFIDNQVKNIPMDIKVVCKEFFGINYRIIISSTSTNLHALMSARPHSTTSIDNNFAIFTKDYNNMLKDVIQTIHQHNFNLLIVFKDFYPLVIILMIQYMILSNQVFISRIDFVL